MTTLRLFTEKLKSVPAFENRVECLGRGQSARWRKTGKWQLGNTE